MSGQDWIKDELGRISRAGLLRVLRSVGSMQGPEIELDGMRVLNFCSNNYLGLAQDKRVIRAGVQAIKQWGASSGASRLIAGNIGMLSELENDLAGFKAYPAALVMNSGYQANLGLIPALADEGGTIFSDELNHASLIDGSRLSRARIEIYRHLDTSDLEDRLKKATTVKQRLIVTESLFSMDGDIAPLREIIALAEKYNCLTLIDDAHATGVLGKGGRGGLEHFGLNDQADVVLSTMSKALGSYGAFVCSSRSLREYLINRTRSFVFATGLNPAALGAAMMSLKIIQEEPARRKRLQDNIAYMRHGLEGLGIPLKPDHTPILPVLLGSADRTMRVCENLLGQGIFVQGIRPPTVPEGTSRLRITVSSEHTRNQMDQLVQELKGLLWN